MFSGHERFFASCIELRTFLSHVPLKLRTERPAPKPKRKAFRAEKYIDDDAALAAALAAEEAELRDETVAADLLRRSGRDAHKTDPSDTKLLREAVAEAHDEIPRAGDRIGGAVGRRLHRGGERVAAARGGRARGAI